MTDAERVIKGMEKMYESYVDSEIIERHDYGDTRTADIFKQNASIIHDALELLKAQELRFGYWVEEPDRMRHWHCSECGKVQGIMSIAMKYCPECGAKMVEHPWAASGCGQAFSPD